jgi:hypothetical protein
MVLRDIVDIRDLFDSRDRGRGPDLPAQVEEMRLYLAAWLRRREEELREGRGVRVGPEPSDLGFSDEEIFGDMA